MALFDWNHNGKKDFMDDYIEYNIYKRNLERIEAQKNEYGSYSKRTTKFNNDTEKENSYSSSNKSTSMADKVLITIGAVAAGILFIGVVVNFNISSSSQDRSYGSYNSRYNSNYNSNNNVLSREREEKTEMETSGYEKIPTNIAIIPTKHTINLIKSMINIMLEITVTQRISMRIIMMILTEKKMQRIIMMMLWRNMGNRGKKVKK